jgi:LysM repeat protein
MKKLPFLLCLLVSGKLIFGQSSQVVRDYIQTFKEIAMDEMVRTGVPASITLAQGIHETSAGQSVLVRKSNNHFGIKCKSDWTGQTVSHDDDARGECFRKYDDPRESYRDHSDFLKNRAHYGFLFKLDPTDYESWAYGLKKAGYATNPKYASILIKLIRNYNLQEYTLLAMDNNRKSDVSFASGNAMTTESSSDAKIISAAVVETQYPSGIFKVNETKATVITKGTSYLKVAEENNVDLARLFEYNDMKAADIAEKDHLLYLQRKRKKGSTEFHIVVPGETLHEISQKEGVRLENLYSYNFLREGMVVTPGEKLYLQEEAPSIPRLMSDRDVVVQTVVRPADDKKMESKTNEGDNFAVHTVLPKETLYSISRKYSVTVDEIIKWNGLQKNDLKTGQQLRIQKSR